MPVNPGMRRDVWRFREYTGDVIGKEIAEAWYHYSQFVIYLGDDMMDRWLRTDVWDRGIVPAEMVRHVQLHIPQAVSDDVNLKSIYRKHTAREELDMLSRLGNKSVSLVIELENRKGVLVCADLVYGLRSRGFVNLKVSIRNLLVEEKRDFTYMFHASREVFEEFWGDVRETKFVD